MAIRTITQLKALFENGDIPNQTDYIDVFDSLVGRGETSEQTLTGQLTLPTTKLSSTNPTLYFNDTDAATDKKLWKVSVDSSALSVQTRTDADVLVSTPISIDRDGGVSINSLKLNNAGAAPIVGSARIVAGSVQVYTSAVSSKSVILPMYIGTPTGILYVTNIVNGNSFGIKSTSADNIDVRWAIVGEVP